MDFTSQYCPERNHLERCTWSLVSALCLHTGRLVMLIGKDHAEFATTKENCADLHRKIQESCNRLVAHRATHGC